MAHVAGADELGEHVGRVLADALAEAVGRDEAAHAQGVQHERLVDLDRAAGPRGCRCRRRRSAATVSAAAAGGRASASPNVDVGDADAAAGEQGLRDAEPGERHAERRAAHRVEPEAHEEVGRRRMAGVLAARASLIFGFTARAVLAGDPHERADALLVEHRERVGGQDAVGQVGRQQLRLDVVAAERVRHLREVVGAEREEVGVLGELAAR